MSETDVELVAASAARRYGFVRFPTGDVAGFVIAVSDSLLLLNRFLEFVDVGYLLLRRSLISAVELGGEHLQFVEHMLHAEGFPREPADAVKRLPLNSWPDVLSAIKAQGWFVMAERATEHEDELDVLVGEIMSVDDLRLQVNFLDSDGRWTNPETLPTSQIACVEFGSPYMSALAKYAASKSPPSGRRPGAAS